MISNCVFFKQKTAYDMRISDWSSDVCSSDLFWRKTMKTWEILVAIGVLVGAASAVAQSTTGHDMSGYAKDAMAMQEQMMAKMQMEPSDNPDKIGRESCRERVCQYA